MFSESVDLVVDTGDPIVLNGDRVDPEHLWRAIGKKQGTVDEAKRVEKMIVNLLPHVVENLIQTMLVVAFRVLLLMFEGSFQQLTIAGELQAASHVEKASHYHEGTVLGIGTGEKWCVVREFNLNDLAQNEKLKANEG